MSPVGRAAPRSAAAIAGQAAGGGMGAREAAGSEGPPRDGGEGIRESEARKPEPGGARDAGEEWR